MISNMAKSGFTVTQASAEIILFSYENYKIC
jgi:hypothetical protein